MKHEAGIFQNVELGGPNGDCWEWQQSVNNKGYGQATVDYPDGSRKHWLVHRLAYKLSHPDEDISEKLICHKCDNRRCCNPDHLFSGTAVDNMQDCVKKGRLVSRCKLTAAERADVKAMYASGDYTMEELACIYNITNARVCQIVHS